MDLWARVLSRVKKHVNQHSFETWFRPIAYKGCEEGAVYLGVPTETFRKCLLENYFSLLSDSIREVTQSSLQLKISAEATSAPAPRPAYAAHESNPFDYAPQLNPRYTFASFVVGASNQFAHAAALAVAEQPSRAYNPLFFYGGVGLGKTHLLHAIGNLIQDRNRSLRLTYMSSEKFVNELVNAIRFDHASQFRQKYRNIDVLLMDDIQFIAGKERTQEEFFHTFNALYDAQKQIVITSDCPPKEIPTLEERLHSRFEWGLIADIQPPDLETKLAILRKKAETDLPALRDDVALYIASNIRSNIRELEGALNKLGAHAALEGVDMADVDIAYIKKILEVATEEKPAISSERVLQAVASFFRLKPAQLKAKNNSRPIAVPRQIAMYICKEFTKSSLPQIGKDFGGKHHTTVLHSIRKIQALKEKDAEISTALRKIVDSLK